MGCNCKAKRNVDKLIKDVNEINKSTSKNYSNKKQNKIINKLLIQFIKVMVYSIGFIAILLSAIPILLYLIITKKPLIIKLPKLNFNEK